MQQINKQICIIGGGPAGSITSLFLSKMEIPHLLLDRSKFPRDKVCGESLDGRVTHILNRLNPSLLEELRAKEIIVESRNWSFNLPKGIIPISSGKEGSARILTKRKRFDAFLFAKAAESPFCEAKENINITEYNYDGDDIVFQADQLEIRAQLGVVAVGFHSGLIKSEDADKDVWFFNRTYYRHPKNFKNNETKIYYFDYPVKCCLYIMSMPNKEFNVELGVEKGDYKRLKIRLEELVKMLIEQKQELKEWFADAQIIEKGKGVHLALNARNENYSDRNLIYVGASAVCVNPITGMGIGNAMAMAEIAAYEIRGYIRQDDFSAKALNSYAIKVKARIKNVVLLSRISTFFFRNLKLFGPFLFVLGNTQLFIRIASRSELIKNIKNPRFYLKRIFTKA